MSDAPTIPPRRPAAQRLREVARDLFYRQGIRATGVEELCRLAGTTKISLYRSFPSKDELIADILRQECEEGTCWFEAANHPSVPARERPAAFLRAAVEELRQPGFRGCALGLAIAEFPDPAHPARKVADAYKLTTRDTLRRLCAEAGARDPAALGDAMLMLVEGAFSVAASLGAEQAAAGLEAGGRMLLGNAYPDADAPAAEVGAAG